MKLRLVDYKAPTGNVGDDFSDWMFSRLIPGTLSSSAPALLFGVGSVLDRGFEKSFAADTGPRYLFGSGARGRDSAPDVHGSNWHVYCVRGPLTAQALGIPLERGIADPAILAPMLHPREVTAKHKVGIVPYFTASQLVWERIAQKYDWKIVSPHLSVTDFIEELVQCEKVFCESMHGAIFADAYGIPWCPVSATGPANEGRTHAFKWTDWTSSMGLGFDTIQLPSIGRAAKSSPITWARETAKVQYVARQLQKKVGQDWFSLSDRSLLKSKQEQLLEQVELLKNDLLRQ